MNQKDLAQSLFPHIDKHPADYDTLYPPRDLAPGARVTRLGPSPTGFIHLGNLYGAFANERLAHQSDGVFYLRIEDTDEKREVEGATEAIHHALSYFKIHFDEGASPDGEKGSYGPYHQSQRIDIYHCFVKYLIESGLAYPCFCTEENLADVRNQQEAAGVNPGYYGFYAKCRDLPTAEIEARIKRGDAYVIRFRSPGDEKRYIEIEDGIRGLLKLPENILDVVLLKQNGVPTYHFAHVVDDWLMRTTHVLRGEEWLSSLPIHIALFQAIDRQHPIYCHTTVLMKQEGETRRKLSKRKDPELSLDYYQSLGYHPDAVRIYLLTILNSNYEEWHLAHPGSTIEDFPFSVEKMPSSGTLFDLDKLNNISKEVLVQMDDEDLYAFLLSWAAAYRRELYPLFHENRDMMLRILAMDRHGEKPRKDLVFGDQIVSFISYFFPELFTRTESFPDQISMEDCDQILANYLSTYDPKDDPETWFDKIRDIALRLGFAAKPKDYKKDPTSYKGHVGHVSTVIRVALVGQTSSPDLWEIQQILGEKESIRRIQECIRSDSFS